MDKTLFKGVLVGLTPAEGDYYDKDGFLMCGKCHTRKEQMAYRPECHDLEMFRRLDSNPDYMIFPKNCDCKRAEDEARERETRKQAAEEQSKRLRKRGLFDEQYRSTTFAQDDQKNKEASRICREYVEKWEEMKRENIGLMFHGDVGGGKTFLASCIANAIIDKGEAVLMTTLSDLELSMNENFKQNKREILNEIKAVSLLVLDDVGVGRIDKVSLDSAYDVINTRYKAKKPTIITTNLTVTAITNEKEYKLRRIYNRLLEMCSYPIKLDNVERRKEIARAKYTTARKIFNA